MMTDPSEESRDEYDDDVQLKRPQPRKRVRWGRRIVLFLFLLAAGFGVWFYRSIATDPIDVETATPQKATLWLAARDFSKEDESTRDKLFDYYSDVIDTQAKAIEETADAPQTDESKSTAKSVIKNVSATFISKNDAKVAQWEQTRERLPYIRVDYVVVADKNRRSDYILSTDIEPGPALKKRWQKRQSAVINRKVKRSRLEKNIQWLSMQWFLKKAAEYDATPDEKKKAKLEKTSRELNAMQNLYQKSRTDANLEPLTRSQAIASLDNMIEGWYEIADPPELARALWFKDLVVIAMIAQEAPALAALYPPKVRKNARISETTSDGAGAANAETPAKNANLKERIRAAVRGYFFIEK